MCEYKYDGFCDEVHEIMRGMAVEKVELIKEIRELKQEKNKLLRISKKADRLINKYINKYVKVANQKNKLLNKLSTMVNMCKSIGSFENGVKHNGVDEGEVKAEAVIIEADRLVDKYWGEGIIWN